MSTERTRVTLKLAPGWLRPVDRAVELAFPENVVI